MKLIIISFITLLLVSPLFATTTADSSAHRYFTELNTAGVIPTSIFSAPLGGYACFPENPVWSMSKKEAETIDHTDFFLLLNPFAVPNGLSGDARKTSLEAARSLWKLMYPDIKPSLLEHGFVALQQYDKGLPLYEGLVFLEEETEHDYTTSGHLPGRFSDRAATIQSLLKANGVSIQFRMKLRIDWLTQRYILSLQTQLRDGSWGDAMVDSDYGKCEAIPYAK